MNEQLLATNTDRISILFKLNRINHKFLTINYSLNCVIKQNIENTILLSSFVTKVLLKSIPNIAISETKLQTYTSSIRSRSSLRTCKARNLREDVVILKVNSCNQLIITSIRITNTSSKFLTTSIKNLIFSSLVRRAETIIGLPSLSSIA